MNVFKLYRGAWIRKSHPHLSKVVTPDYALGLLSQGGYFVRNTYNWDKKESAFFWYVIKDEFHGLNEIPTRDRNKVRRSLRSYSYRKVSRQEMSTIGLDLFNKSRKRFKEKSLLLSQEEWDMCISSDNLDLWMGFNSETNEPVSFAINTLYNDYCDYNTLGFDPDAPHNTYPMYGLLYEMNRYYLEELHLKYVLDGARSITEHSNIQPFLEEKFKFRKAFCDLQLFYRPWMGIVVKILFPFRRWIFNKKMSSVLRQEAWARGLEK